MKKIVLLLIYLLCFHVSHSQNRVSFENIPADRLNLPPGDLIAENQYYFPAYYEKQDCDSLDSLKIVFMGSSVAKGSGAGLNQGYASLYTNILEQRFASGAGLNWKGVNISIGGNNTLDVLSRWESDLIPQCGKYVVYGLSLGNEGIHNFGKERFDRFRENMSKLIEMARQKGMVPVVINCYTRNDFTETDYNFVKEMNLLIHQWDVPSVNVLGAVDDGTGKWVDGFWKDSSHPNNEGHAEFASSFVPSLFDALAIQKPQPEFQKTTSIELGRKASGKLIAFTPEGKLHPFTFSFELKTKGNGTVAKFETPDGNGFLKIDEKTGRIIYTSPGNLIIEGFQTVNDNEWHKITLTHYFARGITFLYVDTILQGELPGILNANKFFLGAADTPENASYSSLLFYRSGMNADEISALNENKLLKSSLEIYAPLDATRSDMLVNLAQSLNTVMMENATGSNP